MSILRLLRNPAAWAAVIASAAMLAAAGAGTPAVQHSGDTPQLRELGKRLFFDPRLSGDGRISCATCHVPELAYADGRSVAQGLGGALGTRNTPSLLNVGTNRSQFWDGRRATLEAQALDPLLNPREHGLADEAALIRIVMADPQYRLAIDALTVPQRPQQPAEVIGSALAAYQRQLVTSDSPFDRYYFGGDKTAMPAAAIRGLGLFQGAARCISCHRIDKDEAPFTDNAFHSLSTGIARVAPALPALTRRIVRLREQGMQPHDIILQDRDLAELGRFVVTLKPADIGRFRTPGLRNVAATAPYMHDGGVATLEDAVEAELYYRSAELGYPLILTPDEKRDLVAFLHSLGSPLAAAPRAGWLPAPAAGK